MATEPKGPKKTLRQTTTFVDERIAAGVRQPRKPRGTRSHTFDRRGANGMAGSAGGVSGGGGGASDPAAPETHLDLLELEGGTYLDGDHTYLVPKHEATADPTVDDDVDSYKVGTIWVRTDTGEVWICVDNTNGAASWMQVAIGGTVITDHGGLTGLGDDDHTQYMLNPTTTPVTDNAIARFDGTGGRRVQDSGWTIDDNDVIRNVDLLFSSSYALIVGHGSTQYFYIQGAGQLVWTANDVTLTASAANVLHLTSGDVFHISGGAGDFGSPSNGMLWYNSTTHKMRVYENSGWADVVSAASAYQTYPIVHGSTTENTNSIGRYWNAYAVAPGSEATVTGSASTTMTSPGSGAATVSAQYGQWSWTSTEFGGLLTAQSSVAVTIGPVRRVSDELTVKALLYVANLARLDGVYLAISDKTGSGPSSTDVSGSMSNATWGEETTSAIDVSSYDDWVYLTLTFEGTGTAANVGATTCRCEYIAALWT